MLLVDDRAGSKDLIVPLRQMGLEVESTRLPFGDLAWEGRGAKGRPVSIGVEFKQVGELVQSLRSERFQGHQLPGMRREYDHSWLLIEGELLYNKKGQLLRRRGRRETALLPGQMSVGELLKRLFVLHLCGGVNPVLVPTRRDTLQAIEALYRTWTDTDLDKHKSHLGIYAAPPLLPISNTRSVLKQFPEVGMQLSLAAEREFQTVQNAANASVEEWAALETIDDTGKPRRLGRKAAERIVLFCKGEE